MTETTYGKFCRFSLCTHIIQTKPALKPCHMFVTVPVDLGGVSPPLI